jgi:hypothetical protein
MKKLLTLTILFTTFIQADENANDNVNTCLASTQTILEKGLAPCKENDILIVREFANAERLGERLLRICKVGTVYEGTCILRAEKDFGKEIDHKKHHN